MDFDDLEAREEEFGPELVLPGKAAVVDPVWQEFLQRREAEERREQEEEARQKRGSKLVDHDWEDFMKARYREWRKSQKVDECRRRRQEGVWEDTDAQHAKDLSTWEEFISRNPEIFNNLEEEEEEAEEPAQPDGCGEAGEAPADAEDEEEESESSESESQSEVVASPRPASCAAALWFPALSKKRRRSSVRRPRPMAVKKLMAKRMFFELSLGKRPAKCCCSSGSCSRLHSFSMPQVSESSWKMTLMKMRLLEVVVSSVIRTWAKMDQEMPSVSSRCAKNLPMFLSLLVSRRCTVANCTLKDSSKRSW
mmetsp:Transcript_52208/g.161709  ORF Transcript_52208/g.161709 Transcript_52208/m.161709 type:complete len:309 (-) Transcript_52208:1415-2341(-)